MDALIHVGRDVCAVTSVSKKWVHVVVIIPDRGRWVWDRITSSIYFIRHGKQFNHTERCYASDRGWTAYLRESDDNVNAATMRALRKSVELFKVARNRDATRAALAVEDSERND